MPLAAVFIGAMIGGLAEFFATWFGKKVAVYLAMSAVLLASWGVLLTAVGLVMVGAAETMPEMLVQGVAFLFPANLTTVITGAVAVDGLAAGYALHITNMRTVAQAG